mmetsp:Transcript_7708/g.17832  ORF Transcript_7708/g.17832 Transcript_7708/m.17832 type:complete len:224 (-) Transcript_7708:111-782(-)
MEGDVGARPGVRGRGEIVGVGLAGHHEHSECNFLRNSRLAGEPLSIRPALEDLLCILVAGLGLLGHIVEGVEHKNHLGETCGSDRAQLSVGKELNQRSNVVSTLHRAEKLSCALRCEQRCLGFAGRNGSEEGGLHIRSFVHTGGDTVGQKIDDLLLLALGRVLAKLDQLSNLLCIERRRHNSHRRTLLNVLGVRLGERGRGTARPGESSPGAVRNGTRRSKDR